MSRVGKQDHRSSSKRRAPTRTIRNHRIVSVLLIFVALIILVDALVGDKGLLAMLRARHEYDDLAGTVARARSENVRLRDEAATIEEVARRELGLIRPGEKVFVIKDVAPAKPPR